MDFKGTSLAFPRDFQSFRRSRPGPHRQRHGAAPAAVARFGAGVGLDRWGEDRGGFPRDFDGSMGLVSMSQG